MWKSSIRFLGFAVAENRSALPPPKERPQVTLILLTFNQERFVREAVTSALNQTYSPLEIVISDDCSSDRTFSVIEELVAGYRGPHTVRLNKNLTNIGLIRHVEQLTHAASGEIIVAAAGDDVSLPNRVARITEEFGLDQACKYVHSAALRLDRHSVTHEKIESPGRHFFASAARAASAPCLALGATAAWRKSLVSAFPRMARDVWAEDLILGFRALLCGTTHYIDEPLVLYRSDSGITAKPTSSYLRQSRNLAIRQQRLRDALSHGRFLLSLRLTLWTVGSAVKALLARAGEKVVS